MKSFPAVTALLGAASAHTIMQAIGGYSQGVGIYMPSDDSPQTNVGSNSIACNGSPINGFRSPTQKITMQAGQTYTGAWLHTLTSTGPDSSADNKVIDSSHKGPVMAYMKKVSDSLSGNPSSGPGSGWFKISQDGYDGSKWGVDRLINAGGIQSFTIPSCIANGDYLVRLEIVALHSAYSQGGAQFYMECTSVTVTGGTGTETPSTVSLPGAYSATSPSIMLNIYNSQGQPYPTTSYTPPGPDVFSCSGNGGSGTTTPPPASGGGSGDGGSGDGGSGDGGSGTTTPPPSSGPTQSQYGQCGGNGWTGPTTCAPPSTCKVSNEWYSQCL